MDSSPDVSEVHAAFIFRVEFIGQVSCCVYIYVYPFIISTNIFIFKEAQVEEWGLVLCLGQLEQWIKKAVKEKT
jgi:hypothetical protein